MIAAVYIGKPPRFTGHPVAGETDPVQIPEEFRKCVVFVCAGKPPEPVGTGFLLGWKREGLLYVVTALHVLDQHAGKPFFVRVNLDGGGSEDIPVPRTQWRPHAKSVATSDLAVAPIDLGDKHDAVMVDEETLAVPRDIILYRVAIGDEIFMPGMFSGTPGRAHMIPAVRFGQISLMPEEEIPLEWVLPGHGKVRLNVKGYLVDCRAWDGFSGAPVFIRFDKDAIEDVFDELDEHVGRLEAYHYIKQVALLGIMHGEFEPGRRTSGLSVVLPVDQLQELLRTEEFVKDRKRAEKKAQDARPKPRPASVPRVSLTKREFDEALRRASRRVAPPDEGTTEPSG